MPKFDFVKLVRLVHIQTIGDGVLDDRDVNAKRSEGDRQYVAKIKLWKKVREVYRNSFNKRLENFIVNDRLDRVLLLRVVVSRECGAYMNYYYQNLFHSSTVRFIRDINVYKQRFYATPIGFEMDGHLLPRKKHAQKEYHAVFVVLKYTEETGWAATYYDPNRNWTRLVDSFIELASYLGITSFRRVAFKASNPHGLCSGIASKMSLAFIAGMDEKYFVEERLNQRFKPIKMTPYLKALVDEQTKKSVNKMTLQ